MRPKWRDELQEASTHWSTCRPLLPTLSLTKPSSWAPFLTVKNVRSFIRHSRAETSCDANAVLGRSLAAYARKNHIPVQYIRQISLLPKIDEFPGMLMISQFRCLDRIMTIMENERNMADLQAADWATGNVGGLREHYLAPANCAADIKRDEQRRRSAVASWTNLLLKALERKETRTFAMIDISSLLRQEGVLMQLRQAGATIDLPPD